MAVAESGVEIATMTLCSAAKKQLLRELRRDSSYGCS